MILNLYFQSLGFTDLFRQAVGAFLYSMAIHLFYLYQCPYQTRLIGEKTVTGSNTVPNDNGNTFESNKINNCGPFVVNDIVGVILGVFFLANLSIYGIITSFPKKQIVLMWILHLPIVISILPMFIPIHGQWQYVNASVSEISTI